MMRPMLPGIKYEMLLAALYSKINGRYINPATVGFNRNLIISASPESRISSILLLTYGEREVADSMLCR